MVPPETEELRLTAVLTVPVVGPLIATINGNGVMTTSSKAFAVLAVLSVTVRVTL